MCSGKSVLLGHGKAFIRPKTDFSDSFLLYPLVRLDSLCPLLGPSSISTVPLPSPGPLPLSSARWSSTLLPQTTPTPQQNQITLLVSLVIQPPCTICSDLVNVLSPLVASYNVLSPLVADYNVHFFSPLKILVFYLNMNKFLHTLSPKD